MSPCKWQKKIYIKRVGCPLSPKPSKNAIKENDLAWPSLKRTRIALSFKRFNMYEMFAIWFVLSNGLWIKKG